MLNHELNTFGLRMGLPGLAFSPQGLVALDVSGMGRLYFEKQQRHGVLCSLISGLSLASHAEHSNYSRSCMASDYRPDIVYQDIVNPHLLTDKSCRVLCVIYTVSVSDHNDIIVPSFCLLNRHINNLVERFLASPLFSDHLEFSLIVHMYDRLYLYKCADHGCRLGDTAASVEVVQVVYRHIMTDMEFVLLDPLRHFVYSLSRRFLLKSFVKEKPFAKARAERINYNDLCLRIFLFKHLSCNPHTVEGSAQS